MQVTATSTRHSRRLGAGEICYQLIFISPSLFLSLFSLFLNSPPSSFISRRLVADIGLLIVHTPECRTPTLQVPPPDIQDALGRDLSAHDGVYFLGVEF